MERRLGNIFGFGGGNYAGNVYDKNYMCPTLNTMQGGYKQPMILANINPSGNGINGNVYSADAESPTITTNKGEGSKIIVAMRGRNPENPSDRTAGSPTEQRLEPNSQGVCNTLTSVQKDNLVLENVYDFYNNKIKEDGVCGTITGACSHNGSGTFGVVETVKVKQATKDGYIECKVGGVADLSFPDSTTRRGRVQDMGDTCPTLTAGESDICRIEKADFCIGGLQEHQTPRTDGINPSLTAAMGMGGGQTPLINQQYRIRKLTPLECWRLMGFEDEDFLSTKIGNRKVAKKLLEKYPNHYGKRLMTEAERVSKMSNTQLYKQAGNSIVKNVLVAIFGQMISGKETIYKDL